MGLLEDINTATGEGYSKSYVPEGIHRLRIKTIATKQGTAKNKGKEWLIFSGEFVETSRTDLPACQKGMPFSVFIETAPDAYSMAANKVKNILNALATEADLASVHRAQIPADCVQQSNNPYLNQPKGMTWGEYLSMCIRHKAAENCEIDVTATNVDRTEKGKPPVTNYDFLKKGMPRLNITPAPIAPKPQPAATQPTPTGVGVNAPQPTPQTAAPVQGGSLFGNR